MIGVREQNGSGQTPSTTECRDHPPGVIGEHGPALLFERPVKADGLPSGMPLVTNLFGTVERTAWGMGITPDRLDELGIVWEAWTDEAAPGQTELNIAPGAPLAVADAWVRTKQVMREIACEKGRSVTFMAKPTAGFGQGAHLNVSLQRDGVNQFYAPDGPSELMLDAVGGLMATMAGATLISLPQITSYRGPSPLRARTIAGNSWRPCARIESIRSEQFSGVSNS